MKTLIRNLCNDKRIMILGFGREGKSTLRLITDYCEGCKVFIGDMAKQNPEDIRAEFGPVVEGVICGEGYQDDIDDYDVVFKSPGIVLNKPIEEYKTHITLQTQEFVRAYRERTIGITGTKGKSTTATLLYKVLADNGIDVILGGNIGIPPFDLVYAMEEDKEKTAILELSCHQLEYMTVSPYIGILLNLYEEHLDHYGTYERYAASKTHIYKHQKSGDMLFCKKDIVPYKAECDGHKYGEYPDVTAIHQDNARASERPVRFEGDVCDVTSDAEISGNHVKIVKSGETEAEEYDIPVEDIKILGDHNYFNIVTVREVAKLFGIDEYLFRKSVSEYNPLPHRLEYVGTFGGVEYYDDSISTIGEAAIQAVRTVKNAETILIGGMDRGIEYGQLEEFLSQRPVKNIILMYETGKRILDEMNQKGFDTAGITVVKDLQEAVNVAKKVTGKGKACIMSPAAASYGYFKNFEERGQVFAQLVQR